MSILISCPKCQKKLKLAETLLGKKIKCPACAAIITVEGEASAAPPADDDEEVPRRPAKKAPPPSDEEDEDEEDRPRKKRSKAARDEEDDDDRPRKGRRKKGKKQGSSSTVLLIVGVVCLVLCGGCGGVGYWFYRIGKGVVADLPANGSGEPLAGPKPATFPAGWKEFRSPQYGFSVMLPGTPAESPFTDEKGCEYRLAVPAEQPLALVTTGYWIHKMELDGADESPLGIEFSLGSQVTIGNAHVRGKKAFNEKSGTFAGKPGRAWDVKDDQGRVWHFRACVSGTKAYIVGAGPETVIPAADAERFFASFELLAR
jgi:hypothetical protein